MKWIVSEGGTDQEPVRKGVYNLEDKAYDEDIIIIHDGIRLLMDETVLIDVILKAIGGECSHIITLACSLIYYLYNRT